MPKESVFPVGIPIRKDFHVLPVVDGEVEHGLGVHHVGSAIVLVARVHHRGPDLADNNVFRFRVAVLIDCLLGVADFHQMPGVVGMRVASKFL